MRLFEEVDNEAFEIVAAFVMIFALAIIFLGLWMLT